MDIPHEHCYLLCNVQRKERRQEVGGVAGHARPDDSEDAPRDRSAARVRHRPPAGASERTGASFERRHGVHLALAFAAGGMDCGGVGRFREQPEGEVLFDYEERPETAGEGDGGLGADFRSDRPRAAARGPEVMIRRRLLNWWTRIRATVLHDTRDLEFQTEIEEHVQLLSERYRGQGMTPEAAMQAARRQFGNTTLLEQGRRSLKV